MDYKTYINISTNENISILVKYLMSEVKVPKIEPLSFSFSITTTDLFFPVDIRDLRPTLARNGYELTRLPTPLAPRQLRIGGGGVIARKGGFSLNFDAENRSLGLSGDSSDNIIKAFDELTAMVRNELKTDLASHVRYYEILGYYRVFTSKIPSEQFSAVSEGVELFETIAEIVGTSVSTFGIRVVPKGGLPNNDDWFDISVEPEIIQPDRYFCGVVCRNKNRNIVEQWASNDKKYLNQIIGALEK